MASAALADRAKRCDDVAKTFLAIATGAEFVDDIARNKAFSDVAACVGLLNIAIGELNESGRLTDPDVPTENSSPFGEVSLAAGVANLPLLNYARSAIKAIRNACAIGDSGQTTVGAAGAAPALLNFLDYDSKAGEGGDAWNDALSLTRKMAWQALANMVAGGHEANASQLWVLLYPSANNTPTNANPPPYRGGASVVLAALETARREPTLVGIIASFFYSCCRVEADATDKGAALNRLKTFVSDRSLYPRLLSFVTSQAAANSSASDDHHLSGPGLEWQLLLTELVVEHGLLQAAFETAGAGTPLSLLSGRQEKASSWLTREQLGLLCLMESHIEQRLSAATDAERSATNGGENNSAYGWQSGNDASAPSTADATIAVHPLLKSSDLSFLVGRLSELCASALLMAGNLKQTVGGSSSSKDDDDSARLALSLRPLLAGTCMLCDILSDILARRGEGDVSVGGGGSASATADPCRLLGAVEARAIQQLLAPPAADLTEGPAPLYAILELLHRATPPPNLRGGKAGGAAADVIGPPPSMVEISEEDGIPRPVAETEPAQASAAAPPPPPIVLDGTPRFPAVAVPAGTRSSLTRLVALACNAHPASAAAVLAVGPPHGTGVFTLLNQCVMQASDPLLREWALLAIRNLCAVSAEAVEVIASVKANRAQDTPELAAMGVARAGKCT